MGLFTKKLKDHNGGERKAKRRNRASVKPNTDSGIKAGRWTDSERRTFLKGLKQFGRGKWKEIATMIPTRSTVQVKTHAQMVIKRVEAGEDVFSEFREDALACNVQGNDACHGFELKRSCFAVPFPTPGALEMYKCLSLEDQKAVHILYQMTKRCDAFQDKCLATPRSIIS